MRIKNKLKLKCIIIGMTPIMLLLNIISKSIPEAVEKYYSTGINKPIRQLLSLTTGIIPTSAAEFLVIGLWLMLITMIVKLVIKIKKGGFLEQLINIGVYLSALYIALMMLWGFNYNRLSFDKIAGLEMEKSSKEQLYDLCYSLIERANVLREKVEENSQGVMTIPGGYRDVFRRAAEGFNNVAERYPELGGNYGKPKNILLSVPMTYTGITGIYIPYTGEANVNTNVRDFMLPCTTAHEMAHQRGFAREDEANYIAYLTCTAHEDAEFQYSGVMLALIYSTNALADKDFNAFKELAGEYSPGVKRDLMDNSEFWDKYEGAVEKVSSKVNNAYLKSNGQEDGVESYGRMVDLLLAEFKAKQ